MIHRLSELRSPQIQMMIDQNAVLLLPFGQVEEHGPHLPVNTDNLIAQCVADAAASAVEGSPPCLLLDPIHYGFSQKVLQRWPGTFIVPQETVIRMLTHVLLSAATMGFRKIVVVSTHGNHTGVCRVAARAVADECGIGPALFFPLASCAKLLEEAGRGGAKGSCHAGEFETSVMLHLAPDLVDLPSATAEDRLSTTSPYPSSQAFISTWTLQSSRSGTYGDPTVATPELGKRLFDRMVSATTEFIRYYHGLKQI